MAGAFVTTVQLVEFKSGVCCRRNFIEGMGQVISAAPPDVLTLKTGLGVPCQM